MKNSIKKLLLDNDNSATKAAIYYMLCQLIVQGMAFLTTPIFSRMLSKTEYGTVSNFLAWVAILFPLLTLNLRTSINKSKYDIPDDNNSFLLSILLTGNIAIVVCYLIVELHSSFFSEFFGMDIQFIRLLFIYLLFYTAFDFQQIQYNIYRKYKLYVLYSIVTSFFSLLLSVIFVLYMGNKVIGRLLGIALPTAIIGAIIWINIWKKGKKYKIKYVKYALSITIPLLPSALSATILTASDRIIITQYCGTDETALYSIPYAVSSIASILWMALNQAWGPWLYDNLNLEEFDKIKRSSKKISTLYVVAIVGIMMIAPEILWILGGNEYMSAIDAMPPVILAMALQFFYAFYFNVEYFYGETYIISLGTLMAAIVNIITNILFVPKYGYIAAAYTTLLGYAIMVIYHYLIVKLKLKKDYIFDNSYFAVLILLLFVLQFGIMHLYRISVLRYVAIGIYMIIGVIVLIKHKRKIVCVAKNLINK